MARLKHYTRALISSYVQLAANVIYTLSSVPLALHYLSNEEFGLWAMTTQLAGYIALLDMGQSGAAMRILIDHKDRAEDTDYGSTILTGFLVNAVQGILFVLCGVLLAFTLEPVLLIPSELAREFRWLVIGQAAVSGGGLAVRMSLMILAAHQRQDLANLSNAILLVVGIGVLWGGFALGAGVFSMLWALAFGQAVSAIVAMVACWRLNLLPKGPLWGRPNWQRFRELFALGRDMFLYSIGNQLVSASQTILLTRIYDLQAAAIWSICTRAFLLISQVVLKIFDSACPALAEMIVRGEHDRLLMRFRSMVVFSASLSIVAGVGLAVGNQAFVSMWTQGRIGWSSWNDCLLALWLPFLVLVRSHTGLVGLTKDFRFLRYVYFLEGMFFVGTTLLVLPIGGVPAMLGVSIAASCFFTAPYGVWRTSKYFGVSQTQVALDWMKPTLRLALWLIPIGFGLSLLMGGLASPARLFLDVGVMGTVGGLLFLRVGLDEPMRREIRLRLPERPRWLRNLLAPA